ncbi:hypothetical protein HPB51_001109 [Rhipicephalus microplus]|uniref:Uncharacterized protein n=1 Tax=Rhipicephalus microplus TaxID=6941 RepID=A0A9J6EVH0_RHIMP|nr:hypothetical protein HPB51_001109 [Rhipicephalus microplus]
MCGRPLLGLAAQRVLGCHALMVGSGRFDTTVFTDFLRWGRADVLSMPSAAAVAKGVNLSLVERATQQEHAAALIVRDFKSIEEKDGGGCILDSSYPLNMGLCDVTNRRCNSETGRSASTPQTTPRLLVPDAAT